jgi:hypothetical protein
MKLEESERRVDRSARTLAPDDLRAGDFVSILEETIEYPSFWWSCDPQLWPPSQPVRMSCRTDDCGVPLKVKAVCLPFVFVKKPCGKHRTLDIRQQRLVRLSAKYAGAVWKILSKESRPTSAALL